MSHTAAEGELRCLPLRISRRGTGGGIIGGDAAGGDADGANDGTGHGAEIDDARLEATGGAARESDVEVGLRAPFGSKGAVSAWHGARGSSRLLVTEEDLLDEEEWGLHFTCFHASRSAALHVDLFGTPVGGAPYACTVLPAATHAARTVVSGLLRSVRAGEPMRGSLRLHDRFGNARWSGGDVVRMLLLRTSAVDADTALRTAIHRSSAPLAPSPPLRPPVQQQWAEQQHNDTAQTNPHRVTADLAHAGPPWTPTAAAEEEASGRNKGGRGAKAVAVGWEEGRKGHTALSAAELAAADYSSELLALRGASSEGCEVVDHADGTFTLTATILPIGRYSLHVFVNERPAMQPWQLAVRPGAPDAAHSELKVGATRGTTGRWVSLYVTTRDVYGNLCSTDDAPAASGEEVGTGRDGNIEVQVVGGEGRAMEVSSVGVGLYESAVVAPVACLLRVAVTIAARHLPGSPFELQVDAGRTASSQTYAEGPGWQRRILVGDILSFTIHAYDQQGNPQNRPGDPFLVTLTPRARGNHAVQLRPSYQGGGLTIVRYEVTKPGSYVLSVTLRGYHIRESPFNLVAGSGFFSDVLAEHNMEHMQPSRADAPSDRRPSVAASIAASVATSVVAPTPSASTPAGSARGAPPHSHPKPHSSPNVRTTPRQGRPHSPPFATSRGGTAAAPAAVLSSPAQVPEAERAVADRAMAARTMAERASAQIGAARRMAVARGRLQGPHPPCSPPVSAQKAFEASVAASAATAVAAAAMVSACSPPHVNARPAWGERGEPRVTSPIKAVVH